MRRPFTRCRLAALRLSGQETSRKCRAVRQFGRNGVSPQKGPPKAFACSIQYARACVHVCVLSFTATEIFSGHRVHPHKFADYQSAQTLSLSLSLSFSLSLYLRVPSRADVTCTIPIRHSCYSDSSMSNKFLTKRRRPFRSRAPAYCVFANRRSIVHTTNRSASSR